MQEVSDTIAGSLSYQYKRRDALREYLFNLNYQQSLSEQLACARTQVGQLQMKLLNLKNSLLQDIPKVLKKENQQRIGYCVQQLQNAREQQNSLKCQLEQQTQKWKHIHEGCDNLKYSQEQPFSFYYNSSVHCQYQSSVQAEFLCTNKNCIQHSAFICGFSECKCKNDHRICAMVSAIPFLQAIIDKLNRKAKRQFLQYFQTKQIIYQEMLDRVSKEKKIVDQWYNDQMDSQIKAPTKKKQLILYGLDRFGKSVYCQQAKVQYGSVNKQLHQNCGCVPLAVKKELFEHDKAKAKSIYSSIISLYADVIEQLQQKRSKIENQRRNFALSKAESIVIARLMQESSLFGIGTVRPQEQAITGQLVYYCRTHRYDIVEQDLVQKLKKTCLRSKWINKVEQEFRKCILGSCLSKATLFETRFPFRQIEKEQILQSVQDIYSYLNDPMQRQAKITKNDQKLIHNIESVFGDQMIKRTILRLQDEGMLQQVINLNTKSTKKLYLKGQLPFRIEEEIIVKKRKQKVRQLYIQVSQFYLSQALAQLLSKNFPELQIFESQVQKSLFNRQFHQYLQFNKQQTIKEKQDEFKIYEQILKQAREKPTWFQCHYNFVKPVKIIQTLKRLKRMKIFTHNFNSETNYLNHGFLKMISQKSSLSQIELLTAVFNPDNRTVFMHEGYKNFTIQSRFIQNQLDSLQNIMSITIQNYQLDSLTVSNFFKRNTKIKSIEFRACNSIHQHLTTIILQNCTSLQSFTICGLKYIRIQGNQGQYPNFLIPIIQIKTLKSLSVQAVAQNKINQINEKLLQKSLTKLEYFQMRDRSFYQVQILLGHLTKNASNLRYVDISNNCITGSQLGCLKNAKNLQTLLCGRNHINGFDIVGIVKYCKKIRKLSIADLNGQPYKYQNCNLKLKQHKIGEVNSKDVISINENARLTHLNIKNCKIQSYCLRQLTNLKVLRISSHFYQSQQVQYLIQKGVKILF